MNRNTPAKEIVYIAAFVALLISSQVVLSFVAGLEIVTVLFISFSFVFGMKKGTLAGIVFTLLRQVIFGFFPSVLATYLIYYPLLAICFGLLGVKKKKISLVWIILIACLCTAGFTLLDDIVTPLWFGLDREATLAYFYASFSVMATQVLCTAITVFLLFPRLQKAFAELNKNDTYSRKGNIANKK